MRHTDVEKRLKADSSDALPTSPCFSFGVEHHVLENTSAQDQTEGKQSCSILRALGDSFSRRILLSAVETGKTVEEISEEQHIPLSTCYRRVREFVDEGLMMLEKIIITQTGKRYAVYRTSFAEVTIRLNTAEITIETSPNAHVREKLRTRWLSANFPAQSPDGLLKIQA